MKRSSSVRIGLLAVIAALAMTGCADSGKKRLVDRNTGQVIPDSLSRHVGNNYYYGGHYIYPWYVYGGSYESGYVRGYSLSAPVRSSGYYSGSGSGSRVGVSRGGFGSSGHGSFGG